MYVLGSSKTSSRVLHSGLPHTLTTKFSFMPFRGDVKLSVLGNLGAIDFSTMSSVSAVRYELLKISIYLVITTCRPHKNALFSPMWPGYETKLHSIACLSV